MPTDLLIRIVPEGNTFLATQDGPDGVRSAVFEIPIEASRMDEVMDGLEQAVLQAAGETRGERRHAEAPAVEPRVLGETLYKRLFTDALPAADPAAGPLRIMLQIDPADDRVAPLLRLPWELVFAPTPGHYLALSESCTLFRCMDVATAYTPPQSMLPLRVLVVLASPSDLAPLDLERERVKIETTWGTCAGVEVDFLVNATPSALESRLKDHPYQVLHFMGHGAFDNKTGEGALALEDDSGRQVLITGRDLAVRVGAAGSLQLVFLNACNTAESSEDAAHDVLSGVAAALSATGAVPAVLAMQFQVSDRAAVAFSESFYKLVVAEKPIDEAVAGARRALVEALPGTLEWATPVLYMRSPSGNLFDFTTLYG